MLVDLESESSKYQVCGPTVEYTQSPYVIRHVARLITIWHSSRSAKSIVHLVRQYSLAITRFLDDVDSNIRAYNSALEKRGTDMQAIYPSVQLLIYCFCASLGARTTLGNPALVGRQNPARCVRAA